MAQRCPGTSTPGSAGNVTLGSQKVASTWTLRHIAIFETPSHPVSMGHRTVSYHFPVVLIIQHVFSKAAPPSISIQVSEYTFTGDDKSCFYFCSWRLCWLFFPREKKCIWCAMSFQPSLLVIIRNPLQRILRRHRSSRKKGSEQAVALVNTCLEPWPFR